MPQRHIKVRRPDGELVILPAPPMPEDLSWQERGLCAQTDAEAFFPEKGGSTRKAKAVCRACEVQAECLQYALANEESYGIWGGTSERERRLILRDRKRQDQETTHEDHEEAA